MDAYYNLSMKATSVNWFISSRCREMSWAIKTDDDMMLDIDAFAQYLRNVNSKDMDKLHCNKWSGLPILRASDPNANPRLKVGAKLCSQVQKTISISRPGGCQMMNFQGKGFTLMTVLAWVGL